MGPKVICREHEDPSFDPNTGRTRPQVHQTQAFHQHQPVVTVPQAYHPAGPQPTFAAPSAPAQPARYPPCEGVYQAYAETPVEYNPSSVVQYGGRDPAQAKPDYPAVEHGSSSSAIPPPSSYVPQNYRAPALVPQHGGQVLELPAHGQKKALLIGVTYKGTRAELRGCANDAAMMEYFLRERQGFPSQNIVKLTDDQNDPNFLPTRSNILRASRWLVQEAQPGDSLVFHFSGHGGQKRNRDGSEADGFDETILPMDYNQPGGGQIVDNELNHTLIRSLPTGVQLFALVDACHSGSSLDLPYICRGVETAGDVVWREDTPNPALKTSAGGRAIQISGCGDDQLSTETRDLSKTSVTGAATYSFITAMEEAIANQTTHTYFSLLVKMDKVLKNDRHYAGARDGFSYNLSGGGRGSRGVQKPQLTSTHAFDVRSTVFI